jgi:hypothetical protein
MNEMRKTRRRGWPDRLSGWTLPPPNARDAGEVEPVRCFESAEAAIDFLIVTGASRVIPNCRTVAKIPPYLRESLDPLE